MQDYIYRLMLANARNSADSRHFKARVKVGHVGRGHYFAAEVPIIARSAKEAALLAKYHPCVKHDAADAVEAIMPIEYEEYMILRDEIYNNPYFLAFNIQQQRQTCTDLHKKINFIYDASKDRDKFERLKNGRKKYTLRYRDRLTKREQQGV